MKVCEVTSGKIKKAVSFALMFGGFILISPNSSCAEIFKDTDMPGQDFEHFAMTKDSWDDCRNACEKNKKCFAWTYVKPRPTDAKPTPVCWLKSSVPQRRANPCCISGTSKGTFD